MAKQASGGADYEAAHSHALAGRLADAEALCREILAATPQDADALHLLGAIAAKRGEGREAKELFGRALAAKPDFAKAHSNLGAVLLRQGETEQAIEHIAKAIELAPDLADAHNNLGNALLKGARLEDAARAFVRAIEAAPGDPLAYSNLGAVLVRQGKIDDAITRFEKAIGLDPSLAMAHNNLGNALKEKGDFEGAAACLRRALELDPAPAEVHSNLGTIYKSLGRLDDALACHDRALEIKPDFDRARFHRALLLLAQGRFEDGWEAYLFRPSARAEAANRHRQTLPRDLAGRQIRLRKDQGLGDELFFLRFAPELTRRGAKIVYQAGVPIASIVERLPCIEALIDEGADGGEEAVGILVGDLPYLLETRTAADIPPPLALALAPGRMDAMRGRLASLGPPPYIGVTWRAGVKNQPGSVFKLAPLGEIAKALGATEGTVLVLQRNPEAGEIEAFSHALGREAYDLTALNDDLEDMLAALSLLDEYVTVSNTNVHLRIGAGGTCRVLVPNPAEYRWMAEGAESPWFPGSKVYRQGPDGDWGAAFHALIEDLGRADSRESHGG
jgi:tetratricopeptide (TPR) repeat protein